MGATKDRLLFVCFVAASLGDSVSSIQGNQVAQSAYRDGNTLDNSFFGANFNWNSSAEDGEVTRVRRRITPIMFMRRTLENDTCSNAEEDFPNLFTDQQRKSGAIIVSFLVGIYCFTLLAIVCDNYFLPCVERICETLSLSQDVAAATFMSMATSAPEFFVNVIGTFITKSDIGIGTVVGSSMFNTLGVAALGSLAASSPIQVDWWPVTRDCSIYVTAIMVLVVITWDGIVFWYEGLVLLVMYLVYFIIMFNNKRISIKVRNLVEKCASNNRLSTEELAKSDHHQRISTNLSTPPIIYTIEDKYNEVIKQEVAKKSEERSIKLNCAHLEDQIQYYSELKEKYKDTDKQGSNLCNIPRGSLAKKIFFFYKWPIKLLLYCLVPNPKYKPKLFPITFIMCILLIGSNSYLISWMITIIGNTFKISDSVMGLTFLAAGGSLPEAISVIIMSRRGEGSMGVSNALGANTMNILLSLGFPWMIKTILTMGPSGGFIEIYSGSLHYTVLGLIVAAGALFATLFFNKFRLCRQTGVILSVIYLFSLSGAIALELLLFQTSPC